MATFIITSANSRLSTNATAPLISSATSNLLIVSASGSIVATGTSDAVSFSGSTGTHLITVNGEVHSAAGAAIFSSAEANVSVGASGVISAATFRALNMSQNLTLVNAGILTGTTVVRSGGAFSTITNSGTIQTTTASGVALRFDGTKDGVNVNTIINTGTIYSAVGTAISSSASAAGLDITNSGLIKGGIASLSTTETDTITNTGRISGAINLGGGDDVFDTSLGTITNGGSVELGVGSDTYIGNRTLADIINSSVGDDTFDLGGGNDRYIASSSDGNDTVDGGDGVDTYFANVDNAVVNLLLGTTSGALGIDTIENFENVDGGTFNDTITGNDAANKFRSFFGNDTLDGSGAGADTLDGGADNDTYIVDGSETIIDVSGTDTVQSSVISLDLGTLGGGAIENATLFGSAGLKATGNGNSNILVGSSNSAANVLTGLGGDDSYFVGAGDTIVEAVNGGNDTVLSSLISLTLSNFANVEKAKLIGSSALNLTGDAGNNTLTGNSASNIINGAAGNDTLTGAGGADFFVFDSALSAATNVDTIADFVAVDDTIRLAKSVFTAYSAAGANTAINAATFRSGAGFTTAGDANDFVIYDTTTGDLFYDADGNAAGSTAVKFATLTTKPTLTNADFVVV